MRILWVSSLFLHPQNRGGPIRSLQILRRLHARHEVHYAALASPDQPEGPGRALEYSSGSYPVPHHTPPRRSASFALQLAGNLLSDMPLPVARYSSPPLRRLVARLLAARKFDRVVCDFLQSAPNLPDLSACTLFQHNVETIIWERNAEHAPDPLRRAYFRAQARKMLAYEQRICRAAASVIAVSPADEARMRARFGVKNVAAIPTGVEMDYFARPAAAQPGAGLVFAGSMDSLSNIDGVLYFVREILPHIRRRRPECVVTIAGKKPAPEIVSLAAADPLIRVTGTVEDIRPYLFEAGVSIVPLRIGGGTRIKIYEAMAAGVPVVSTTVGAEGLEGTNGEDILLADDPKQFADRCLDLVERPELRARIAGNALALVSDRCSADAAARAFEDLLLAPAAKG